MGASPSPVKQRLQAREEGREHGSECGQAPGYLQVDQTSLWLLLPLHRGMLGVRDTGVGACRCPTLKDPSWQIRPSAQKRSHHTGRPGFPDGGGCSLHGSPEHRAARGRLFTRTLRPRPGLCRREGDLSSAMPAQPQRAGRQPPAGQARPS